MSIIFILLVLTTLSHSKAIFDIDGDDKEGLAEAVHALRTATGLVQPPVPNTFINSFGMGFRLIQAGSFLMGSPDGSSFGIPPEPGRSSFEDQHYVTLTNDYYMQQTEVTNKIWNWIIVNTNKGVNPSLISHEDNQPVDHVNWFEAAYFSNELSKNESLEECYLFSQCNTNMIGEGFACDSVTISVYSCNGYRLPTEAEWEYAARAGSITALPNGDLTYPNFSSIDPLADEICWFYDNSPPVGTGFSMPVATKKPNRWGLYDISGNVKEWCQDGYIEHLTGPVIDPTGATSHEKVVIKGGSHSYSAAGCRPALRIPSEPTTRTALIGFRLMLPATSQAID